MSRKNPIDWEAVFIAGGMLLVAIIMLVYGIFIGRAVWGGPK